VASKCGIILSKVKERVGSYITWLVAERDLIGGYICCKYLWTGCRDDYSVYKQMVTVTVTEALVLCPIL